MKRRTFLQTALAAPLLTGWSTSSSATILAPGNGWRTFEVITKLEIAEPGNHSRAWIPLPYAIHTDWHKPLGNTWNGNGTAQIVIEPRYGAEMLYAEWQDNVKTPVIEVISRFATRDRSVDLATPDSRIPGLSQSEIKRYTEPTELIPVDGIVRDTALDITRFARTDIEKAQAIYEWIVDNTFRDPKIKGCGRGDVKTMLETRYLGGKCADLNTLFVGLTRSIGIPARDIYGLRIAPSQQGYKSLGLGNTNASKAQHCRAECFIHGFGWIPVDPADVRKVVLEEPPGNLQIDDPKVSTIRKQLFGNWEMNWLAYNTAHDVVLPHTETKLAYFMYPHGETGGKNLDPLDPESFRYTITAHHTT